MMIIRQPNRMIGEQQRQEKARLDAEFAGKPRPISNIGGGQRRLPDGLHAGHSHCRG